MLIEISCLPITYIQTYFIEQFLPGIFIMLFTGLQVRIEKYLPEVSKMILRPRANIFLQGPTKTVNNIFIDLFFSKSKMRPLCPAIEKYRDVTQLCSLRTYFNYIYSLKYQLLSFVYSLKYQLTKITKYLHQKLKPNRKKSEPCQL